MKKIKVTRVVLFDSFKVKVNDVLHLSLKISSITGIYAYKIGAASFHIDIHTPETTIECTYSREDLWMMVLEQFDTINLQKV